MSEYEYLVDDTLGMLLHLTGLVDGTPEAMIVVDELVVDAPLSAEVFTFAPPTGTYVVHARRRA